MPEAAWLRRNFGVSARLKFVREFANFLIYLKYIYNNNVKYVYVIGNESPRFVQSRPFHCVCP